MKVIKMLQMEGHEEEVADEGPRQVEEATSRRPGCD
jgi:hypothetical protein